MRQASLPLFIILLAGLVFAQNPPILPAVYWGKVTASCSLDGGVLRAYVGDQLKAQVNLIVEGSGVYKYGEPKAGEQLLVITLAQEENGSTVTFKVCLDDRCVTVGNDTLISDSWKEMDFTVTSEQCTTLHPPSGGGGVTGEEVTAEENVGEGAGAAAPSPVGEIEIPQEELPPADIIEKVFEKTEELSQPSTTAEVITEELEVIEKMVINTEEPITTFKVHASVLRSAPAHISSPPKARKVIKYLSVALDKTTKEKTEKITLYFRVPRGEVEHPENVRLAHYRNGSWTIESTTFLGTEGAYYRYRADVSSLSYFAIIELETEKPAAEQPTQVQPQPTQGKEEKEEVGKEKVSPTPQQAPIAMIVGVVVLVALLVLAAYFARKKKR